MDTNLVTISDISNPIAKNISETDIQRLIEAVKDILNNAAVEPFEFDTGVLDATVRYFIGTSPLPDLQGHNEPEFNKHYLLNFYIDNLLHSSYIVLFLGMNEGLRWYCFEYIKGDQIQGKERHLLNAADSNFPNYSAQPYPGVTISEQYLLIP